MSLTIIPEASAEQPRKTALPAIGQRLKWHKSAPSAVRRRPPGDEEGWAEWRRYLAERRRRRQQTSLLDSRRPPLLWGLAQEAGEGQDAVPEWAWRRIVELHTLARKGRRQGVDWSAEAATFIAAHDAPASPARALEMLAWCSALPALAEEVPSTLWWRLLETSLEVVEGSRVPGLAADAWTNQLLSVELPFLLANLLPELQAVGLLCHVARDRLFSAFEELLDGEGMLRGRHLGRLRPLLACWTRVRVWAPKARFRGEVRRQYEGLVRHVLRLARADGSTALGATESARQDRALLEAAAALGRRRDRQLLEQVLGRSSKEGPAVKSRTAAMHSEWSEVGVLRSDWSATADRLVVDYSGAELAAELATGRAVLFSGGWPIALKRDDCQLQMESAWEEVCWFSDDEVDYLELESSWTGQVRVQRQMLLSRRQRYLLAADAVLGEQAGRLEYRTALPLVAGVAVCAEQETREIRLRAGSRRVAVLPLALSEWRSEGGDGALEAEGGRLVLRQRAERAASLFAPLFFDLDPKRQAQPLTWRRLTVAEDRMVQPPDVAAGYRVQVGKPQWLIYRSLGPEGNRTLLGHNLVSQYLVARFTRKGAVEPVLEIE